MIIPSQWIILQQYNVYKDKELTTLLMTIISDIKWQIGVSRKSRTIVTHFHNYRSLSDSWACQLDPWQARSSGRRTTWLLSPRAWHISTCNQHKHNSARTNRSEKKRQACNAGNRRRPAGKKWNLLFTRPYIYFMYASCAALSEGVCQRDTWNLQPLANMRVYETRDKRCNEFGLTQAVLEANGNRPGDRIATCYPYALDMSEFPSNPSTVPFCPYSASPSAHPRNYSYWLITPSPRTRPHFPLKSPTDRMRLSSYTCYESPVPLRLWLMYLMPRDKRGM